MMTMDHLRVGSRIQMTTSSGETVDARVTSTSPGPSGTRVTVARLDTGRLVEITSRGRDVDIRFLTVH